MRNPPMALSIHKARCDILKIWIVERTFAWMGNFRRLAKDFEILTEQAENFVRIAMIKITLGAIANV